MNNLFILFLIVCVAAFVVYAAHHNIIFKKAPASFSGEALHELRVGDRKILVVIADTQRARAQGLSGVSSMRDDQGMLFVFGALAYHAFVMRDMLFGLDFVWIKEGKIVGFTKNIPAPQNEEEELIRYHPPQEIDMVLEVRAGTSERLRLHVGDAVELL